MRVIACIEEQDVAKKILVHLGLPSEPLPSALELFLPAEESSSGKSRRPVR